MKIEFRNVLETIGLISVVLSLIFVGLELRQSNRLAVRDAAQQIVSERQELVRMALENPEFTRTLVKLASVDSTLSPDEEMIANQLAEFYIGLWQTISTNWEAGYLPRRDYDRYIDSAIEWINDYPKAIPHIQEELKLPSEIQSELWQAISSELGRNRNY